MHAKHNCKTHTHTHTHTYTHTLTYQHAQQSFTRARHLAFDLLSFCGSERRIVDFGLADWNVVTIDSDDDVVFAFEFWRHFDVKRAVADVFRNRLGRNWTIKSNLRSLYYIYIKTIDYELLVNFVLLFSFCFCKNALEHRCRPCDDCCHSCLSVEL